MKHKFPSLLPLAILMAAGAAADPSAGGGTAPTTNVAEAEKKARAPKDPANKLNIINGRIPLPLVALIRFKTEGVANATIAKQYGTSVGKIFDIKKNANFAYIDATYKPSAEEIAAAKAWLTTGKTAKGQTLAESGGTPDEIGKLLDGMGVATADEVAKRAWAVRVVGEKKPAAAAAPVAAEAGKLGAKLFDSK